MFSSLLMVNRECTGQKESCHLVRLGDLAGAYWLEVQRPKVIAKQAE